MHNSTYSPVENIPTVNTMQAHDRSCKKSMDQEKKRICHTCRFNILCAASAFSHRTVKYMKINTEFDYADALIPFPCLQSVASGLLHSDWLRG